MMFELLSKGEASSSEKEEKFMETMEVKLYLNQHGRHG